MGFQQGLSGLNASSRALDVVGNNIANSGTVGFKTGSAQFADVFAASLNGAGSTPVGIGTKVAAVVQQFTQGNISVTNNPLDLAINGGGFFIVDDGSGGNLYSRNGQFQLNKDGYIVNAQGQELKGRLAVDGIVPSGAEIAPLRLFDPTASLTGPPQATGASTGGTGIQANVNLDSREGAPTTATFNHSDPTSYNTSTATTIYDSLGNPHTYSMYFVKTSQATGMIAADPTGAAAQAAVTAAMAQYAADPDPIVVAGAAAAEASVNTKISDLVTALAAAATPADQAALLSAFEADATTQATADALAADPGMTAPQAAAYAAAAVSAALGTSASNQWTVYSTVTNPSGASPTFTDLSAGGTTPLGNLTFDTSGKLTSTPMSVTLTDAQLGYAGSVTATTTFPVNFSGSTQYGSSFTVNTMLQDGFASGTLSGFNVGKDGIVLGRFTNGQNTNIGQVVLASFRNPNGLQPLGDNTWARTPDSGEQILGSPASSGQFGPLQSASLEDANVDLTQELVYMITLQRAYQANAQTIKTQDQVLQTLVNLR